MSGEPLVSAGSATMLARTMELKYELIQKAAHMLATVRRTCQILKRAVQLLNI
jgi:hypothetical protein